METTQLKITFRIWADRSWLWAVSALFEQGLSRITVQMSGIPSQNLRQACAGLPWISALVLPKILLLVDIQQYSKQQYLESAQNCYITRQMYPNWSRIVIQRKQLFDLAPLKTNLNTSKSMQIKNILPHNVIERVRRCHWFSESRGRRSDVARFGLLMVKTPCLNILSWSSSNFNWWVTLVEVLPNFDIWKEPRLATLLSLHLRATLMLLMCFLRIFKRI